MSVAVKKRSKNSYAQWDHLTALIAFPVYETEDFIVFIDSKLEIEWETSKRYDDDKRKPEGFPAIHSRYNSLEASIQGVSSESRKQAVRRIAQGITAALGGDIKEAHVCMDAAETFIVARNRDVGRVVFVRTAAVAAAVVCGIALLCWLFRSVLQPALGELPFSLVLYGAGGSVGALFFVVHGVGVSLPEPQAEQRLHVLEAICRIALGVIGGAIIALMVRTGLLLPQLNALPLGKYVLMILAVVAGKSETFASNLMDRLESGLKSKEPKRLDK